MTKLILACDIDSCIYDSQKLYSEAAEEIYGFGYEAEDVTHYYWLKEKYGNDFWQIFNKALHPSWIDRREIYPGAVECLTHLRDELDTTIHFITYNIYPDLVRKPLNKWLTDHFGDVGLSVTGVDKKIPIMRRIGAFGIVEDKYPTLVEARESGLYGCGKLQPHNKNDLMADNFDFFDDWLDGKDILSEVVSKKRDKDLIMV